MARKQPGIYQDKDGNWKIDALRNGERLRGSFGKDLGAAEAKLIEWLAELAKQNPAHRVRHSFEQAASHYIQTYPRKPALEQEIAWLKELLPHIGALPLDRVYDATLKPFVEEQRKKPLAGGKVGVKSKTINLKLGLVRHILRLASRSWRDEEGDTWLPAAPLITMVEGGDEREPRQLTWQEERDHLEKLPPHLYRMAKFVLQCGCRDEVVCSLEWEWEVPIEELGITAFIVPPDSVKGQRGKKTARVLVCNSVAKRMVDQVRGQHPKYVFAYQQTFRRKDGSVLTRGEADHIETMNNTAWQRWRKRCGLGDLHVHDLRHTVGMRLREAGVAEETRADILWHRRQGMPQHYAKAQIIEIFGALEKITDEKNAYNKTLASIASERRVPTLVPTLKNGTSGGSA